MNKIALLGAGLAIALAATSPAEAKRHHHHRHHQHRHHGQAVRVEGARDTVIVGSRPTGCPHAFCGCEASLFLFGKIIPTLNLAANWLRFPRAEPAPHMVAARPGHVFVLLRQIAGDLWLTHDGNSGRHMTREHVRSIRGYRIVNPRGGSLEG
ncbi:hypothetical protein ACRQ5Q_14600 [Bradyrhizobium sp. PMVTL-01]|uniref:hypothetical protein n=1 Tax=Bradyrhizobium sp. PMVTL-01 TaxID=3434999 RepID=UPI003F715154